MSADYSDMIAKLQIALAQQQNQGPSLFGLQSQTDPNQTAAVLKQMQNQQVVNQAGTEGTGQYAYLHNAGQKDFARAGLGIGNLLGLGQPAQQDNSNVMAQRDAIQQGKQEFAQASAQGMDPNQAQLMVLGHLAQAGVPGAADKLEAAQTAMLKNAATQAETRKNNSQADMDTANIANQADEQKNRAFQQASGTWQTTYTDPNGLFMLQKNANGETKRVELKPPPSAAAQAAANLDPASIQFAADTYRTTGKFPGSFGKSPALQSAVLKQVATDAAANGDTAGAIQARAASLKAGSTALDQVTKQEAFTSSAVNTLDKNLQALQTLGSKLDETGSPIINKAINHFNQGVTNDPNTAAYVAMLNAVQGEYAKIASNNNGNSPVSDSAKADAKEVINKAMSQGGIGAVRQAMMQESQNRMQAIAEAKQGLVGTLSGNAPGAPQGKPPVAVPAQPPAAAPAVVDFSSLK